MARRGEGQRELATLLDTDLPMWPLVDNGGKATRVEQDWPESTFYYVIEALHDLVARPRSRSRHDYGDEWDYCDFACAGTTSPGRCRRDIETCSLRTPRIRGSENQIKLRRTVIRMS